jgi:excisionase family DNA binding protein
MDARARYLTPAEAASELRVSTDTVLRLIAAGDLAALRVSSRIIRIPVTAFAAFQTGRQLTRRGVVRRKRRTEVSFGAGETVDVAQTHDLQPA